MLSSHDGYLLELTGWTKVSQASWGVWREVSRLASRPCRRRRQLNKQDDNIQHWGTPFPIWIQSVVPCPVLTVASWLAYRFLKSRSGGLVFPSLSEFSTVYYDPHIQSFGIISKEEIDVFLELSCFFHDPVDVSNLISGSSAFSKTSLNIWNSWFAYYWSLAWRILSITLLACEMSAIVR